MLKGRSQTQIATINYKNGLEKKLDAIRLGWPHLGTKKSTASVEDGEQDVAAFWKKIWQ